MAEEPTSQPSRTYAGKYQSPEALESGYNELFRLRQREVAAQKALEEQNRLLQATLAQLNSGGQSYTSDDSGSDGLSEAQIAALVDSRTADAVQRILDPLLKGAEAVTHFGANQGAISQFLSATPEIQATFQSMVGANPEGAARYAELEYERHLSETKESNVRENATSARATREAALPSAALPPSRSEGRGIPNPTADHDARVAAAWEKAEKSGDASEYARTRLENVEAWWPGQAPPASYQKAQAEGNT